MCCVVISEFKVCWKFADFIAGSSFPMNSEHALKGASDRSSGSTRALTYLVGGITVLGRHIVLRPEQAVEGLCWLKQMVLST
mmetsp:Transcript_13744/g.18579  ORF Transcript_13744/g.18579 Transcript_13744/m.18579 type:complete len:82 (+) Transcript_13744:74-319(+)